MNPLDVNLPPDRSHIRHPYPSGHLAETAADQAPGGTPGLLRSYALLIYPAESTDNFARNPGELQFSRADPQVARAATYKGAPCSITGAPEVARGRWRSVTAGGGKVDVAGGGSSASA
jgi:hypothetical protein